MRTRRRQPTSLSSDLSRRRLALVLMAAGVVVTGLIGLAGCGNSVPRPTDSWGGYPTWLPTPTQGSNQVLPGSIASPALTEQGDGVRAELPGGGTVLITITGPSILNPGTPNPDGTATGTWSVWLSQATVAVDLAVTDFAGWDSTGAIYHPLATPWLDPLPSAVTAIDELPVTLQPGHNVVFNLTANLAAGEGVIQWAPDGHNPVGTWDFVLEND